MNPTFKMLATTTLAATALAGVGAFAPAASAAPAATKTFAQSFTDTCAVNPFGNFPLGAAVTGTAPTTVVHGAAFKLTNLKIKVTVPGSLNATAAGAGAKYQRVTFQIVNINNKGITPAVADTVKTDFTTGFVPVVANKPSVFTAPATGGLSVALKAGAKGTGTIQAGSVQASFTLYDKTKTPFFSGSVVCGNPKTPVTLTTIPIS